MPAHVPTSHAGGAWTGVALPVGVAAVVFLIACSLARGGFFSSADPGDVGRYHEFALSVEAGQAPYRDFYMEYPPGALPAFLAPAVLAADDDYNAAFKVTVAVAGVCLLGATGLVLWLLGADRTRIYLALGAVAVTPLALGAVTLNRYDLWPTLVIVLSLAALLARRERLAFGLLALGCAIKVFPAVVLPVALIHVLRRCGRRKAVEALTTFAVVLCAIALPFAVLAPGGFWYSIRTQLIRQLQLESLGASLLLGLDAVGGYTSSIVAGKPGSLDLAGGLPDALGAVTTVVLLVALALVVLEYWRAAEGPELLVAGFAASVAAFVTFSKVVSPQFLIWLVPLVALVAGRMGRVATALLLACLVATQVETVYEHPLRALEWPVWVLLLRNCALVAIFVLLVAALRSHAAVPHRPGPRLRVIAR